MASEPQLLVQHIQLLQQIGCRIMQCSPTWRQGQQQVGCFLCTQTCPHELGKAWGHQVFRPPAEQRWAGLQQAAQQRLIQPHLPAAQVRRHRRCVLQQALLPGYVQLVYALQQPVAGAWQAQA